MGRRGVLVTLSPMTFAGVEVEQQEQAAAEPSVWETGAKRGRSLDEDFSI